MKKSKVLSTPTRISDLRFEEFDDADNDIMSSKVDRINARRRRLFRRGELAV